MPQMNGRELAHRLRQARAGLPVLFVSASANPELLAGDPEPGSAFLAKPFDRGSLSRAVRRVLDPD
jgi:CheY-like chemotaxis protein